MNVGAIGVNLLFTGVYGLAYVALAVLYVAAWGRAGANRRSVTLLIISTVAWVMSFMSEMTVFGIFSALPLIIALVTAIWALRAMRPFTPKQ